MTNYPLIFKKLFKLEYLFIYLFLAQLSTVKHNN